MFVVMVGGGGDTCNTHGRSIVTCTCAWESMSRVRALFVSLLCIVMYEPYALLHDVSIHLSFIATMGIVYMSGVLQTVLSRYVSSRYFVEICATTLAAYIATLPLLDAHIWRRVTHALLQIYSSCHGCRLRCYHFLVVVGSFVSQTLTALCAYVTSLLPDLMIAVVKQGRSSVRVYFWCHSYTQMIVVYALYSSVCICIVSSHQ